MGANTRRAATLAPPALAALLAIAYLALFWSLDALPLGDLPNHLTRAAIISDLLFEGGHRFGQAYRLDLRAVPYVLGDLGLAALVHWFGPWAAGRVWACLVAASLPAAVVVYLRSAGFTRRSVILGGVLSLYLATDWFFVNGFGHYRLAVALTLLALAAWERVLQSGERSPWPALTACSALLATGYLVHLSTLLFGAVALALTGAVAVRRREASLPRAASFALPVGAIGLWQLHVSGVNPGGEHLLLLSPARKVLAAASPFLRYDLRPELPLIAGFVLACALLAAGGWGRTRGDRRVATSAALCLAFLGLYAALPHSRGSVAYIDVRALPFGALFALFGALALSERAPRPSRLAPALAAGVAAANLAVLAAHLRPANAEMRAYRDLASRIPSGARVLTVATRPPDGRSNPFLHAGTLATLESGAITPYLFQGGVTPYFRALHPGPPAPSEFWYQGGETPAGLLRVAQAYDYCLLMIPFDPLRIPLPAREIARNGTAALLALRR